MTDLQRPPAIPAGDHRRIDGNTPYREVEACLESGESVLLTDTWGTALTLYGWLRRQVRRTHPANDYLSQRAQRTRQWRLTRGLLAPIAAHRVALRKAPEIPWLERLYPEQAEFCLPLADVLGLNGSWQWYTRGLQCPGLESPLHPYHGVYFSPRGTHLELFHTWLAEQPTPGVAVDVGVGAGPLTFLLLEHGVRLVHATDTNPNAIVSVRDDLASRQLSDRVQLEETDLLGAAPPADLIVCNPPWVPGDPAVPLDTGNHYPADWFERFFSAAAAGLGPEGRLVLLFSNFAHIAGLAATHPIADELERNQRLYLVQRREAPVPAPSPRQPAWRRELHERERVELWELALA